MASQLPRAPRVAIGSLRLLSEPRPGQCRRPEASNLRLLSPAKPGQLMTEAEFAEAKARNFGRPSPPDHQH